MLTLTTFVHRLAEELQADEPAWVRRCGRGDTISAHTAATWIEGSSGASLVLCQRSTFVARMRALPTHHVSKSSALTRAHPVGQPFSLRVASSFASRRVPSPGRPAVASERVNDTGTIRQSRNPRSPHLREDGGREHP